MRSAYRCRDCNHQFWVVSRAVYQLTGLLGAVLVVGVLVWARPKPAPVDTSQDEDRFATLLTLAKGGDRDAEYELSTKYTAGYGVKKDLRAGLEWLERAAGHGLPAAQYDLGMALYTGRYILQDYNRAVNLIQQAAQGRYPQAELELGKMYRTGGGGLPVDKVKAYVWLNLAADSGNDSAPALRDATLKELSPAEVDEAQEQSKALARKLDQSRSGEPPDR